jgi:hypothetical protein
MVERMTKADELNALADRCERENGGMHLDQAILSALGYTWRGMAYWHRDNSHLWKHSSKLTTSLDATVRPEGDDVFWRSGHDGEGPDPSLFRADVLLSDHARTFTGRARTEPMARRAAELRARAALSQTEAEEAK